MKKKKNFLVIPALPEVRMWLISRKDMRNIVQNEVGNEILWCDTLENSTTKAIMLWLCFIHILPGHEF